MEVKKLSKENITKYILYMSKNSEFSEAVNEWRVVNIEDDTNIIKSCICGLKTTYYYQLLNIETKNTVHVGQECLKLFPTLKDFAAILLKQWKHSQKDSLKRLCHVCIKLVINKDEPAWKVICKQCFIEGTKIAPIIPLLNHRVCEDCFVPAIDPNLPTYRTKCSSCFKHYQQNQQLQQNNQPAGELKECVSCGRRVIKEHEKIKLKCYQCYQSSRI